jgi:hypothetical protein
MSLLHDLDGVKVPCVLFSTCVKGTEKDLGKAASTYELDRKKMTRRHRSGDLLRANC